ncbi:MAG: peptide chain release factor N(5)-glutamine methyltransferase [Planctomycetota bacterium]
MTSTGDKESWTILELLNWTASYFAEQGIPEPRLNAQVLLAHVMDTERIMLYARFDEQVDPEKRAEFRRLVRRRASREPLQYLVGGWEFYGRHFALTPAVLVPRQETELLAEKCLEKVPEGTDWWAADIGTGSGVIAVTLACERPGLELIAVDSSAEALEVAARNAARHGVEDRIRLGEDDLAEPLPGLLPPGREGVELLVSNPPYVPTDRIASLEPEVRDWEPRAALDGGEDGLHVIRRLVPQAAEHLLRGGWLVLELGEGQADPVTELAAETAAYDMDTLETVTDSGGCRRVFCVRKGE